MDNIVRFNQGKKRPASGKAARRKIGRDVFALLVLGLGIVAVAGIDTARILAVAGTVSSGIRTLAFDDAEQRAGGQDSFPVSSIDKATRSKARVYRGHYPVCSFPAARRRNCVIDGDTFYLGGDLIRISDIDAPETHPPRCAREADLGDRATTRLSSLLSAGPFQLVRRGRDLDKYGRRLRIVMRDDRSIGGMLVAEGLARPWTGKRRPWCPNGPST